MPDRRRHRGPHPQDRELFAPAAWPDLEQAVDDLAWLLSRGYVEKSALKLVGDRYGLRLRQRLAVLRSTCSDDARVDRQAREVGARSVASQPIWVDGYNILITVEAALAGGILLLGRDGCLRDMASIHGSFRRVQETDAALALLGETLASCRVARTIWYLDKPVSNSGRLAARMRATAKSRGWAWDVRLVQNPDGALRRADGIIVTADSVILDHCGPWLNLARYVVDRHVPDAAWIDLSAGRG